MSSGGQELGDFWRRAVRLALSLILIGAAALYFFTEQGTALALGLMLGGAASVLRFNLRYRVLTKLRAAGPLVRVLLVGYVLNGLVLASAFIFRETISPWSTAAGLLAMNASVVATEVFWREKGAHRPHAPAGQGS